MEYGNLSSYKENGELIEKQDIQEITTPDQVLNKKSDSFAVDMEPFSCLTNKDLTVNSKVNLQRCQSRKGHQRGNEKKMNIPRASNERDASSSAKAALLACTMPEKSMLATDGITDHATNSPAHHQIIIITSAATTSTTNSAGTSSRTRLIGKRSRSFKQLPIINPRRILFFFASLSSIGTIVLIYFTLSMAKYNRDNNA